MNLTKHINNPLRALLCLAALALILSVGLAPMAFAQGGFGGFNAEQMRERSVAEIDSIITHLALNEETAASVQKILEKSVDKRFKMIERARESGAGREGMRAMRADMELLQEETDMKLADVLSEVDLEKYKKIRDEKAAARRGRRGNRRGGTI